MTKSSGGGDGVRLPRELSGDDDLEVDSEERSLLSSRLQASVVVAMVAGRRKVGIVARDGKVQVRCDWRSRGAITRDDGLLRQSHSLPIVVVLSQAAETRGGAARASWLAGGMGEGGGEREVGAAPGQRCSCKKEGAHHTRRSPLSLQLLQCYAGWSVRRLFVLTSLDAARRPTLLSASSDPSPSQIRQDTNKAAAPSLASTNHAPFIYPPHLPRQHNEEYILPHFGYFRDHHSQIQAAGGLTCPDLEPSAATSLAWVPCLGSASTLGRYVESSMRYSNAAANTSPPS